MTRMLSYNEHINVPYSYYKPDVNDLICILIFLKLPMLATVYG